MSSSFRQPLAGVPCNELEQLLSPLPPFRARQIFEWMRGGAASFAEMTNLPQTLRLELEAAWSVRSSTLAQRLVAKDRTEKLQIMLEDNAAIEAVLLVDGAGRKTACISTQAGCPMACVFCKTGSLGFLRNLNASEIVEQFYHLGGGKTENADGLSNIVFMGMGEPLLNLAELRRAVNVLSENFSLRRITVSTCGIIDGILDLAENGPHLRLAVSIPSARQPLRDRLMPGCAAQPLVRLKEALLAYQKRTGKRITLETALMHRINTGNEDAAALAAFTCGLDVIVNLIPWNPAGGLVFDGATLKSPANSEVEQFKNKLETAGVKTSLRRKKGGSLSGACGQLGIAAR